MSSCGFPHRVKEDEGFKFQEDVSGRDNRKYLWGKRRLGARDAHDLGLHRLQVVHRDQRATGWGAAWRSCHPHFKNHQGRDRLPCPTEVAIWDRRDAELDKLGFTPLCHYKHTDKAVFFERHVGRTCPTTASSTRTPRKTTRSCRTFPT